MLIPAMVVRRATCFVVILSVMGTPMAATAQVGARYVPGAAALYAAGTSLAAPAVHETSESSAPGASEIVSVGVALGISIGTLFFAKSLGPVPCGPCDPADVPALDRGTIRAIRPTVARGTDIAVLGTVGGTWIDLGRRDPGGNLTLTASVESLAWTMAVTQVLKVAVRRIRPFMYSDDAPKYVNDPDARQSFPSGHTSAAFAVATSYFLSVNHLTGDRPYWIFGAAAFVGAGRVLSGKHWITDVLAGAAIGTATALVVHEVRVN